MTRDREFLTLSFFRNFETGEIGGHRLRRVRLRIRRSRCDFIGTMSRGSRFIGDCFVSCCDGRSVDWSSWRWRSRGTRTSIGVIDIGCEAMSSEVVLGRVICNLSNERGRNWWSIERNSRRSGRFSNLSILRTGVVDCGIGSCRSRESLDSLLSKRGLVVERFIPLSEFFFADLLLTLIEFWILE